MKDLDTWQDLLDYLNELTSEQRQSPIQISMAGEDNLGLGGAVAIGTVEELDSDSAGNLVQRSRSSYDNRFHPEDIALLIDGNPFAEDGSSGFVLQTGERIYPKPNPLCQEWYFWMEQEEQENLLEGERPIIFINFVRKEFWHQEHCFEDRYLAKEINKLMPFPVWECMRGCFCYSNITPEQAEKALLICGFTPLPEPESER